LDNKATDRAAVLHLLLLY